MMIYKIYKKDILYKYMIKYPINKLINAFEYNLNNIKNDYNCYLETYNNSNKKLYDYINDKRNINLLKFKIEYPELYNNNICSICTENINIHNDVYLLSCFHIFHAKCLNKWIKKNKNCPHCRNNINISLEEHNLYGYNKMVNERKKLFKNLLIKYIDNNININELIVFAELLGLNTTNFINKNKLMCNINNKLNLLII